ncbi:TIGR01620 family protein [Devosia sp. PTR5]|uniref:TIGR01620 family protein n=1 Tax=Devosia oryzisoli TaxID=2774138 RepID=A0A927FQ96_9HYPH|nr:TIGR01620 family protein [Devosia oryzisoli]MBD8064265.1 TIGR01620 family protein [Devosia oryzisoli]
MKQPVARPTTPETSATQVMRAPRAFAAERADVTESEFDEEANLIGPPPRRMGWLGRLAWSAGGVLLSAAIGLAADRLIRDLFAANPWLGGAALGVLAIFILALAALVTREIVAVRRLRMLDALRREATTALATNDRKAAGDVAAQLLGLYAARPDMASGRQAVETHLPDLFDGGEVVQLVERSLVAGLDARARALTAASARRVALVTAVSPRALIDVAYVIYESVRLAGAIAALYGARPGFLGFWRLTGAVLSHLAVTGGLVLTDGIVEQLIGQGLAAKVSARLGEGVVNGLMTVRVGIAAMRVVRPLPFETQPQPVVRDFIPDLVKVTRDAARG